MRVGIVGRGDVGLRAGTETSARGPTPARPGRRIVRKEVMRSNVAITHARLVIDRAAVCRSRSILAVR
jgi:hypothetical protein